MRDPSLSAAVALGSPSLNRRNSAAVVVGPAGLGAETAKYKREESIREIKQSFEHQFQVLNALTR